MAKKKKHIPEHRSSSCRECLKSFNSKKRTSMMTENS